MSGRGRVSLDWRAAEAVATEVWMDVPEDTCWGDVADCVAGHGFDSFVAQCAAIETDPWATVAQIRVRLEVALHDNVAWEKRMAAQEKAAIAQYDVVMKESGV